MTTAKNPAPFGATQIDLDVLSPTILVVDDELINTTVLSGMLNGAGFRTMIAMNGPDAREKAETTQPDLILLDIMMPGEDGFETCRQLKQVPATQDIPVIFISALTSVKDKVAGLELGAVDYICKPFDRAEVMARIRLHLKLKFATRALVEAQAAKLAEITAAQQAILVTSDSQPEANFAVRYVPALEAGGDFYDVFSNGHRRHTYFVADVCGHDLGASFVTSSLKALLRQNSGPLFTPLETMKHMNLVLKTILQSGRFLSAQSMVLNRLHDTMELISAGHPGPIFVSNAGHAERLDMEGDVLGVFENAYLGVFRRDVRPGDRIYLYTDGLVERFAGDTKRSQEQGEGQLLELLRGTHGQPLGQTVNAVVDAMFRNADPQDDVVLMGVEV